MAKRSKTADENMAAIMAIAAGQSKPVNHPSAAYPMAYRTQDALLAGIGRRVSKR